MLSDRFIRNAKPGLHADENGLYLRVYPSGKKSFVHRSQNKGKNVVRVLGGYPAMSLAQARAAVENRAVGSVPTVREAFEAYVKSLQYRRPEQVRRMFESDVLTDHGGTQVDLWTKVEIMALLQKVVDRGRPVMANRLFSQIKSMLTLAEHKGWIQTNPLASVTRKFVGGREEQRDVTLSWDEIVAFHHAKLRPDIHYALRFILLTGLRPSEALWVLTTGRTENIPTKTTEHRIPRTPAVRAAIKLAPPMPKDHRTLSRALRRLGAPYTPHDLRRTFATRLADLGVMPHVIEKLLNHKMEGVMAVYNRADYWPERVTAMRLWARKLNDLRKKDPQ